jgi:membrane protease YdiL (CAAX protease family)
MFKGYKRFWNFEHILLILLAIGGLLLYIFLYEDVFPSGVIDFRYTKDEIIKNGESFLNKQGLDLDDYKKATVFGADNNASVYLSKNLNISGMNKLVTTGKVPIWRWELRWFKAGEKEEYRLNVTPRGKIVGFLKLLPEEEEGENLSQQQAKTFAINTLKELHPIDISQWELIEESSEKLPNRTDHHFVWENRNETFGPDGRMRIEVDVAGDKLSKFRWFLKIPENFVREYENQQSYGNLLGYISVFFMIALIVGAVIVFLNSYRKRQISIKFSLAIGLIMFGAYILMNFNFFPTSMMNYDTSSAYSSFITSRVITGIISAIMMGVVLAIVAGSGDILGHRYFKKSLLSFDSIRNRIWGRNLSFSSFWGVCLIFIFIGLQTIFYFIGTKYLGVWAPAENEYSEAYGSLIPLLTPITISILAAFGEEFIFRLFGISLIKKITGSVFIGAFIASAIWALGHSTYAIYPVYTRAIELTLLGLLFSFFYLRYGLMAVIIGHFGIDTIYIGFPLLKAGNTTYFIYGVIVMIIAILPLAFLFLIRRKEYLGLSFTKPHLTTDTVLEILQDPFKEDTHIPQKETQVVKMNTISVYLNHDFGGDRNDITTICARFASLVEELLGGKYKNIELSEEKAIFEISGVDKDLLKLITGIRVGIFQVSYQLSEEKDTVVIEKIFDD